MTALAEAETLIQLRRWPAAVAVLSRVVASEPGALRARCLLAQALLGMDKSSEARAQAEAAIALDPTAEWPHRLRSLAFSAQGHKTAALGAAREAVRLAPNLVNGLTLFTGAAVAAGRLGEAEEAAQRALASAPESPSAHNAMGRVALARRQNRMAEGHFREGLRLDPEDPSLLNNLGLALSRQGRKSEAVAYFASSSQSDPTNSTAHRNAVRTAAGAGWAVGAVAVAQVVSTAVRPATQNAPDWLASVVLVGLLAFMGVSIFYAVRRRRRQHDDPKASPELIRSLRRQWLRRLTLPNVPGWVFLATAALSLFLAVGALANLVSPDPGDSGSPAAYGVMLGLFLGLTALLVWVCVRRWRAARG